MADERRPRHVGASTFMKSLRKLARLARALVRRSRVWRARRAGIVADGTQTMTGKILFRVASHSRIELGPHVVLNADPRRNTLEARGPVIIQTILPGARIVIGKESGLTSSTLSAATAIQIGERVLIGAGCLITDSDHHVVRPLQGESRRYLGLPEPVPNDRILIEDDVFIGARSIVLKGVRIGQSSVIAAGSIVTRDIPPYAIAAGNPCKVVGTTSR